MQYAKLVDGNLAYATNPLRIGTRHVYTTDPTPYGYKQVVRDAPTRDGYVAVHDGWQETDTQIVETYRMEPLYVAEGNVKKGDLFDCGGQTWEALHVIVRGEQVIEGYNATRVALLDAINDIKEQ